MRIYEIEVYVTDAGAAPLEDWIGKVRDETARTKLYARLDRASHGNFGDCKDIEGAHGLFEIREHHGQGYRIFYSAIGRKVVLILAGSTKQAQDRTIAKAKAYLHDYRQRMKP